MYLEIKIYPKREGQEELSTGNFIPMLDAITLLEGHYYANSIDRDAESDIYDMQACTMKKITHTEYGKLDNPVYLLKL